MFFFFFSKYIFEIFWNPEILLFTLGLSQALGTTKKESAADFSSSKLSKVTQLTGFSDPVYAEAYVHVHQYDIVLDVLIVNQVLIFLTAS